MVTRTFVLQKEVLFTFIFFSCNFYELRLAANDFFFRYFSEIKGKDIDWQKAIFNELSGSRTLSGDFMERVQKGHYNKFECGSKVEVCDKRQNFSMCVATIIKIVGDRLWLAPSCSLAHLPKESINDPEIENAKVKMSEVKALAMILEEISDKSKLRLVSQKAAA